MKLSTPARQIWVYAALYLFLVIFFLLAVRSGDDLTKLALTERSEILGENIIDVSLNFHETLNGRVLGNAMHYLLVGIPIVNAFLRAGISLAIVWSIARLSRMRSSVFLPLVMLVTLMPTVPMLKQALIWSAGYYNYVVPAMLVLLLIILIRDASGWWVGWVVIFVAFAASLFAENVTITLTVGAVCLLIWSLRRGESRAKAWSLLLGAVCGATLMFSSPVYSSIAAGDDNYRTMPGEGEQGLGSIVSRSLENLPLFGQNLVTDLAPLYLIVAVCMVWASKCWKRSRNEWVAPGILLGVAVGLNFLELVGLKHLGGRFQDLTAMFLIVLFFIYVACLLITLFQNEDKTYRTLMLWPAFGLFLVSPFLVITPYGPRNFYFTALCFFILGVSSVSKELNEYGSKPQVGKMMVLGSGIVALGLIGIMGTNKAVEIKNSSDAQAQYASGSSVIHLRAYPFPSLVQDGTNSRKYAVTLGQFVCNGTACARERSVEVVFE